MSASTDLCDLGIQLRQLDLSSKFEKTWAPMAPAPKPLPKPQPLSLSHSQATNQQAQQHQQLAQQRIYPQPPTPTLKAVTSKEPMTNGYDERDKDELVMHSRAKHPFKTVGQIKSEFSGQKRGF